MEKEENKKNPLNHQPTGLRLNNVAGETAFISEIYEADDYTLITKVKEGNEIAFNQIFNKYRSAVYSICYRFVRNTADAEDLTQEIFMKVYRKANTYNRKAKFSTWLYRVTVNHCLSFKRRERNLPYTQLIKDEINFVGRIELKKSIDQALLQLPKQQRMVFILRHFRQLSFNEIGEIMKISTGAAKAHHHFAIMKLKEQLTSMGYGHGM